MAVGGVFQGMVNNRTQTHTHTTGWPASGILQEGDALGGCGTHFGLDDVKRKQTGTELLLPK